MRGRCAFMLAAALAAGEAAAAELVKAGQPVAVVVSDSRPGPLNRKGKRRRTRGTNRIGQRPDTKRAIVTLTAGEIPLFEN